MAGLNIVLNDTELTSRSEVIEQIQKSLNLDSYSSETFVKNENVFIGWNKYADYPITGLETGDFKIILEGKIYNKTDQELIKDIGQIFSHFNNLVLRDWLLQVDGDFIIYIYNKRSNTSYVFNDILGRLPLYFSFTNRGIIITRHIRFVTALKQRHDFDRTALAEYLMLGYMLGERTLFENIRQLRPASLLTIDNSGIEVSKIHEFNFEIRENKDKSFKENVKVLSELLSKACIDRLNNNKLNLLALSSGLDSRTVAGCLRKNNIPYETVTMVYENGHGQEEVAVAEYIAGLFNVKWQKLLIPPPTGKHMYSLLEAKEGMNFLATAPMLPFYEKLRKTFVNDFNFITGDKSDKIALLYDIPVGRIKNGKALIKHILSEHAMVDLEQACEIAKIDKDEILNDFLLLLNTYPEKEYSQKYIHFRAIEKSHKLAFHGDDRHKRYIWSYCPLTSSPFVIYAFNCPEKIKKMHKLFIALMDSYSSDASKVLYTNFKAPVTSLRSKLFMGGAFYIYPLLSSRLNNYIKNVFFEGNPFINEESVFYRCIRRQLERTPEISNYLNINDISYLKKFRMHMLSTFFTLTSVIEYFNNEKSTFFEFQDTKFDYRH